MNIPKTPFKLNDNDLIYDIIIESAEVNYVDYKPLYHSCDICGNHAHYLAVFKRKHDEHQGRIYTQNLCRMDLIKTIERLGITE